MPAKKAKARIEINSLLQESGWRLIDNSAGAANVVLENNVKISQTVADDMGEDFEKITKGYADYLLLDEKGFPLIVLEAKSEDKNPLVGKEQARKYAEIRTADMLSSRMETYINSGILKSPTLHNNKVSHTAVH